MSSNGIGALERGYRRTPQRETLALLADALELNDDQRRAFEAAAVRVNLLRPERPVNVGPWPDTTIANLPISLTSFVGRAAELDEIGALVRGFRLVTLTGSGGVGKTQTALHVATMLHKADYGAVSFVELAPIANPSLVVAAIAATLSVQEAPNHTLLETLLAYLKNKALLLILDNCEHVIAQAASVAGTLLAGCPRVQILATSREPLRAAGERSYRLPSLSIPSTGASRPFSEKDADAYGAIALFRDRASAVDPHFTLTDENAPTVAELCRRLDGIPLAIELAAARVNLLSVRALAEMLDDRFRILAGGQRTAFPRQQTMRATIDWSYDLLSETEQRIFERLSVFAGGCTLETAGTVCVDDQSAALDVFDSLSSLVDKSLVVADLEGNEPRYRLLESFRQYARERLVTRNEQEVVAHRHARACLELAQQLDRAFYDQQEIFFALASEELDNWRAALQWTLADCGDVLLGQRLTGELSALWQNIAQVEGRRWIVCAMQLVDERTPTRVLARLSYAEAIIDSALEQHKAELASSQRAIACYRTVGDPLGIALAQGREAMALFHLRRIAEADSILQDALPFARRVGNRWLIGWMLRLCAAASAADGDLSASRDYIAEALTCYEALGSDLEIAWATVAELSWLEFRAGDPELALQHATNALGTFRAFNHARGVVNSLNLMSIYLVSLDRYCEARSIAREALDIAREQHLDVQAAYAIQHVGAVEALRPLGMMERGPAACIRAARVLGFVHARLAAMGSVRQESQSEDYVQMFAALRDTMGTDAVAKHMTEGATMTEEQAVEEALTMGSA